MAITYAPAPADLPAAYADADSKLQGRCSQRRKIANNTWLERRGEDIAIRLHQTDIVTLHADGTATLDTGGWLTVTTKSRMNDFLRRYRLAVYSDKGRWYLYADGEKFVPYADGMRVGLSTHTVEGAARAEQVKEEDSANTAMRKAVNTYIRRTKPEDIVKAFTHPGGDCLICRWPGRETEADHLQHHLEDQYVMYTLTRNAVAARGFVNPDVIMSFIYNAAQRGEVDRLYKDSLRKYLRKHLAVGAVATK